MGTSRNVPVYEENIYMELKEQITSETESLETILTSDKKVVNFPEVDIQKNGNVLNIFSLKKINEISLFDQCGRVMKLGERVNDHKYKININIGFYKFMALVIKVALEDCYVFKRVDIY